MAKLTRDQIYGMGVKWVKEGTYTYKGKTYNSYNDMYKVVEADYNAKNNQSNKKNTVSKPVSTLNKDALDLFGVKSAVNSNDIFEPYKFDGNLPQRKTVKEVKPSSFADKLATDNAVKYTSKRTELKDTPMVDLYNGTKLDKETRKFLQDEEELYYKDRNEYEDGKRLRRIQLEKKQAYDKLINLGSEVSETRKSFLKTQYDLKVRQEQEAKGIRAQNIETRKANELNNAISQNGDELEQIGLQVPSHPLNLKTYEGSGINSVANNTIERRKKGYSELSESDTKYINQLFGYYKDNPSQAVQKLDELISRNEKIKVQQVQQQRTDEETFMREREGVYYTQKGRSDKKHPSNYLDEQGNVNLNLTESEISAAQAYLDLTPKEREDVDFWWGYYGRDEASKRMSSLANQHYAEKLKEASKENWGVRNILAPATNIGTNLAGVAYGAEVLAQEVKNKKTGIQENVPEWSMGSQMQRLKQDSQEAFVNGDEGAVGKVKEFGLGLVNTATTMAIAGQYAPFLYAAQAGGDSAYETTQKGGTNSQALAMGAGNALVTYLTAQMGVEKLIFGKGGVNNATRKELADSLKQFVAKELGTATLTETAEGWIENTADGILDMLVNGDNSDIALNAEVLMKNGYTKDAAYTMALNNKFVKEGFYSALSEGLGGLILGGGHMGINMYQGYRNYKNSGGVSSIYNGVEVNEKTTAKDVLEQLNAGNPEAQFDEDYAQGVLDEARAEMEAIPEETRKMMDFYSKYANVRFVIGDTDVLAGQKAGGAYVNSADVILLDFDTVQDSNEVARTIVNHELTHSAERSRHYDALKEYAFGHMFNESNTLDSAIAKKIDRYGKRGVSLDTNGAEAELVAEYMGKLMSSPEAVEKMVMENKPLAKSVLDSLVETYKKVTTYFKDRDAYEARYALSDIEQGIRLFEKALKTRTSVSDAIARGMGIDTRAMGEGDGVQYNVNGVYNYDTPETLNSGIVNQKALKDYYANVDKVLNGTYKGTDAIVMGGTPKIMTDIGLNKLPISIDQKHIYSIAKTEAEAKAEGRYKEKVNYHGLGDVAVKEIINKISNPIAIVAHPDFKEKKKRNSTHKVKKRDSTHKVIVLVDLTHNGQQVIAPIEIDSEKDVGNFKIDTNHVATYFDKRNVSDILKEAVALETHNKTGFYFADIKKVEALLKTSGYQLPSRLRTHDSNIIIRKINENVNRNFDTVLKSRQFANFFGDWQNNPKEASKVVNTDGTPKILYHQTANIFTIFDTRHEGAGSSDNETPFGIFLKPSSEKIGVKGDIQMPLYANIRKPLEVANRTELVEALQNMSSDFAALYEEDKRLGREYQRKIDEAEKQFTEYITKWRAENPDASRSALYDEPGFDEVFEAEDRITEEWGNEARKLELKTKEVITQALKDNGYDGVHLLEDAGGFGKTTETYIALDPTQVKSATDNIGTFDKTNPDIRFANPVASAETETKNDIKISSNKAKNYYERYVRTAKKDIGKIFGIPGARLSALDGNFDTLAGEYFHTGKISDASKEALFEKAWKEGIIIDDTNKDFAKDLRKELKSSKLYISPDEAKDIPDFGAWRKSQIGNMMVSTANGYPVDSKYQELNAKYGDNYFPLDITAPSDQLQRIAKVMEGLKPVEYTLEERESEAKEDYRKTFLKGLGEFEKRLSDVSRYERARELTDVQKLYNRDELTIDEANEIYKELKKERKNYEKVIQKELLTPEDAKKVDQILAGEMDIEDLNPEKFNVDGITRVVEAKAPVKLYNDALDKHKKAIKARRFKTAEEFLKGSDFWKEKKFGVSYAGETMERNIRDIMGKGSEKQAEAFVDHYFTPVHEHEAQSVRNKNYYRQRVADLGLSDKIAKGNSTSERFAVQFLGEVESDLAMLTKRKYISEKAQGRIKELTRMKEIFLKENPKLDYDKINNAISEFRNMYDELFVSMNNARIRNGYAPVEYRQGYFPHFLTDAKKGIKPEVAQELGIADYDEVGGIFGKFVKALGISTDVNNLPTNIAGKTQDFKPGIKFTSEALQRKTNKTDYDAVTGFDRYIESVSDVIYHTDDIQELRALERQLRYEYSEAGVKEKIDSINDDATLPEDVKQEALERLYERNITKHGNLAQEISEYTNLLANKKSKYDRTIEGLLNRKAYNVLNWANKNVAGNMIAGNVSSALTNFIPITQASAECSQVSILKAARDTVKNFLHNDGFEGASTFLTNRKGSEILTKSTSTKVSDVLSKPMEFADVFTSNVVTRAKFYENIKNGMSEAEAIKDADKYAASLIADRSKGALPTIFGAKNPLAKTFTMFQVEVNNQYGYLFKDLPRAKRDKAVGAIAGSLLKYFIGAYLFNDIYEKLVGRRPALDAIGFANEISGDFFGGKFNNSIDIVNGLLKGEFGTDTWFDTPEKKKPSEALKNIASNVAEDTPFIGGIMGGGRVPISSALPDVGELSKLADSDVSGKKKADIALKEGSKALYAVVPFGLNQAKKTHQGIATVAKGGSYSINNKGEEQLQYPVYNDSTGETVRNYVQGALFGKSALPEAQKWVKSGFKSMSAKNTERYKQIAEQGRRKDAHQTLLDIGKIKVVKDSKGNIVESVGEQRYNLIQGANIPEGQKAWLELSYWDKEAKARADKAKSEADISDKQYVDAKYKYDEADAEKYNSYLTKRQKKLIELTPEAEKAGDYKKFALFNEEGLTAEQKRYLDKNMFGSSGKTDYTDSERFYLSQMSEAQNAKFDVTSKTLGVNAELYYTYLKFAGSGKKDEKKANLQKYGMTPAQADAFYELAIKNRKAGDVHDQTAYKGLSENEKKAYNTLKGYREYVEMDAAEFKVYLNAISNLKTDKEKIELLQKYKLGSNNMSEVAAKGIVKVLGM